jgi:flagellar biosynthesis/type III secretory pathway protein FliH
LIFKFPVVKLVDWRGRGQELLASDNPFAMVVLAHLKVMKAKSDVSKKFLVKCELMLLLRERGYTVDATQSLLRFLDWLIRLPEELERKLENEIDELTEGKRMPYVTSWERRGEKRGRREGKKIGEKQGLLEAVILQLKRKLGKLDADVKAQIEKLSIARLKKLAEALLDFTQPDDLERWLKRKAG